MKLCLVRRINLYKVNASPLFEQDPYCKHPILYGINTHLLCLPFSVNGTLSSRVGDITLTLSRHIHDDTDQYKHKQTNCCRHGQNCWLYSTMPCLPFCTGSHVYNLISRRRQSNLFFFMASSLQYKPFLLRFVTFLLYHCWILRLRF